MRLIVLIILGLVAFSIFASLIGPMIVLGIGATLVYLAYKSLVIREKGLLSIIWWVLVGITGVKIIVGAFPGFIFVLAVALIIYYATRNKPTRTTSKKASDFDTYSSFEAEWKEVTR